MKKIFTHTHLGLLCLIALLTASCEREQLGDVLAKENYPGIRISLNEKEEIGTGSTYTLTGGELKVPVTLNFSTATSTAFAVELSANLDTIAQLITNGTLLPETVALEDGLFSVPTVVNVPIGVKSIKFDLAISRSFIEMNYRKNVALALKISNPAKGNSIEKGKDAIVIVVKTAEVMDADDLHTISFGTGTSQYPVPSGNNYDLGSEYITVSVPISLNGAAGAEFTVDAVIAPDSVTKYINNGTLENSVLYPESNISVINPKVRFEANKNSATLTFTTKLLTLLAVKGKQAVVGFTLKNPNKYQVANKLNTVFVMFDQYFFRPYYGTPFVISGTIDKASDPIYGAYYDLGGEGVAFHDSSPDKSGDKTWRLPDGIDVSDKFTPRNVVGWIADNEWVEYTVDVEETGTYEMNMLLGSSTDKGRYTVYFDEVAVTGLLSSTNTGDYDNAFRDHKSTVNLVKGRHVMKMFWNIGAMNFKGVIFTRKS